MRFMCYIMAVANSWVVGFGMHYSKVRGYDTLDVVILIFCSISVVILGRVLIGGAK